MIGVGLNLLSGICWSVVYVAAILHGVTRRTYCIPWIAICLNVSWEMWAVVGRLLRGSALDTAYAIQLVWLVLDVAVVVTWLVFDTQKTTVKKIIVLIGISLVFGIWLRQTQMWEFSAFFINLVMSAAFVYRLVRNHTNKTWTSNLIARCKLVGTLAATLLDGFMFRNLLIIWIGGLCFIFDLCYLFLLRNDPEEGYGYE